MQEKFAPLSNLVPPLPSNLPDGAKELAEGLNPVVGFFDPLGLATADFWSKGNEFTYGWIRQAEIKHGRIAMAAFVGFIAQEQGYHWPFPLQGGGVAQPWYAEGLAPPEQWDALPFYSKVQIILFVGFLEFWSEFASPEHYCKGGKPGYYPPFNKELYAGPSNSPARDELLKGAKYSISESPNPFPVPSLFQPFGPQIPHLFPGIPAFEKLTEADKARGRLVEINNGRLAMIGFFGFLAEEKIPGSVPALAGLIKPYAGEVMNPF
jgi:hypothetical protein